MSVTLDPQRDLEDAYDSILRAMRGRGRVLVAFSGGVDSGVVLKLAHDALGDDCLAVIADSPSLARRELIAAKEFAEEIGAPLEVVELLEMENEDYCRNSDMRCYFCRSELSRSLMAVAASKNFGTIADGANASDLGDYRPGMRAMDENGFWHPLLEFGLDKDAVRRMAVRLGLSIATKPSTPCLSSRIAYGDGITVERLAMVEAGEDFLHGLGFDQVRVRYHGGIARIEVPREDVPRLLSEDVRDSVHDRLTRLGFRYVTVDLHGYRAGSMNQPR